MRTFRAYSPVGDSDECPCCRDALVLIKRELSDIGHLLADRIPCKLSNEINSCLEDVRQAGRIMLVGLADSLRKGDVPARPVAFADAIAAFERTVDDLAAGKEHDEPSDMDIGRLDALRSHFSSLCRAVNALIDDCETGSIRPGL